MKAVILQFISMFFNCHYFSCKIFSKALYNNQSALFGGSLSMGIINRNVPWQWEAFRQEQGCPSRGGLWGKLEAKGCLMTTFFCMLVILIIKDIRLLGLRVKKTYRWTFYLVSNLQDEVLSVSFSNLTYLFTSKKINLHRVITKQNQH